MTFGIEQSIDSDLFELNSTTGALAFAMPPDYENPKDEKLENIYSIKILVSDGKVSTELDISIVVKDEDDTHPE